MKRLRRIALLMAFVLLAVSVLSVISAGSADMVTVKGTSGDVTGDDTINSKDLTRLSRYLASAGDGSVALTPIAAADVTGDGLINSKDMVRLMRYLASFGDGSIQLATMETKVDTASVFTMTEEDGRYRITAYKGPYESVTIPTTYNGKPVDSIAAGAFAGAVVKSVTFEDANCWMVGNMSFSAGYLTASATKLLTDTYASSTWSKTGHVYSEWVTVTAPATASDSLKRRCCTVCGKIEEHVIPTMALLPFFDGTEYAYTLRQPDDAVMAENKADIAFLQGVLTELCGAPIGTCEANCENVGRPLISVYYEGDTLDYAVCIDPETGAVTLTGGGKEALQRAFYTFTGSFLHVNADGSVGLINNGDFVYDYSKDKIDNSAMLEYIPSDEVTLSKSNYAGNATLMSPDWMETLVMVEVRLDTASIGGSFRDSFDLLDHYAAMGVNGIWLTPIYDFGTQNGYGNCGPHTIDPRFTGTTDYEKGWLVAKEFVDYAHSKGIYIFFDVITWGANKDCLLVQQHPDWFDGEAWGNAAFNWMNEEFVEWFIETCVNNIMVTGADGFRCDCEPNYSGYAVFEEVRNRLNQQGKYVMIMAEDRNSRESTYDMEQDGVIPGTVGRGELYQNGYNFFVDGFLDIVHTSTSGNGLTMGNGNYRFYTNCISNHDYQKRPVQGNRLKINYAAILAPYIPLWYQGEEFNSYNPPQVIYDGGVDHAYKDIPANTLFFEDVKAAIRIRHTYPDLFAYWPLQHVNTNLCGVTIEGWEDPSAPIGQKGTELSAYARYVSPHDPKATTEGMAFLVVPNHVESVSGVGTITIPVKDAYLEDCPYFKVTDMSTGRVIAYVDASNPSFTATIPYNYAGMYLVEGV